MTYSVDHVYVNTFDSTDIVPVVAQAGFVRAEYSASGEPPIHHPSQFNVVVKALYYTQTGGEPPSPPSHEPAIGRLSGELTSVTCSGRHSCGGASVSADVSSKRFPPWCEKWSRNLGLVFK